MMVCRIFKIRLNIRSIDKDNIMSEPTIKDDIEIYLDNADYKNIESEPLAVARRIIHELTVEVAEEFDISNEEASEYVIPYIKEMSA